MQSQLAKNQIVIVGAGGLGHGFLHRALAKPDLLNNYRLHFIDADKVEYSNLNRQIFYTQANVGSPKIKVLEERLSALAPEIASQSAFSEAYLDETNAVRLLRAAAIVIDATDGVATKFFLNDFCTSKQIPLIYAGVAGHQALVKIVAPTGSCLRCAFTDLSDSAEENCFTCQEFGILGAFAGLISAVQLDLCDKYLAGSCNRELLNSLFSFSTASGEIKKYLFQPNPGCQCQQV
ncbi:ThiF family adenylyltransferase [bacterium]|nr:ThiF family adenylyltransferase [bacterium]